MKKFAVVCSALWLTGCFNFKDDLDTCHRTGGCTRDGGGAPQQGVDPVFFTSAGWGWEFPFPASPGLHSVAAVSDDEVWATGDDDSVLHWVDGAVTFSRVALPVDRNPAGAGGVSLALADGGVVIVVGNGLYVRADGGWNRQSFPLNVSSAKLGADGVPWFGGQWQPTFKPCSPAGAAVVEGIPPGTPICAALDGGSGYIVGFDPAGWALDGDGNVLRREVVGGVVGWKIAANNPTSYFGGDVLALSGDAVLVVGINAGRSAVLTVGGGIVPVIFDPLGSPEEWTSLTRSHDSQSFFVAGKPGVYRCRIAVPLVVGDCTLEQPDDSYSLEKLALAPTTLFAVGDDGQLLRRSEGAGWSTIHQGGVGSVNDVWADSNGELWAAANNGWLLHRTAAGWERRQVSTRHLTCITRTSDGLLWIAGDELLGSWDPNSNTFTDATISSADGSPLRLLGSGMSLGHMSGTERGNTWAGGNRVLLGYGADGTWQQVPLPKPGDIIAGIWASDAGTAWAVGGYQSRLVLFWNGTQWQDRTPSGVGEFGAVWGPNGSEAFVSGDPMGAHFLSDGGVVPWDLNVASFLSGGSTTDGGFVVFGGRGTQVWRAPNGLPSAAALETSPPRGRYLTRVRLIGSKIFVAGSRDENRSFLLSLDAGL